MLGVGITVDGDRVMVGVNGAKFGEKSKFGKLTAKDKKGEEAEGRERRGGGGGIGNGGLATNADFYQRDIL